MRTTLTIEDGIARQLRDIAHRSRRSFKAVVNDALRAGLQGDRIAASARTDRVEPVVLGGAVGQHDLDQALGIADQLERPGARPQGSAQEVILVDANLLIYAVNRDAVSHGHARDWLEEALSGTVSLGLRGYLCSPFSGLRLTPASLSVRCTQMTLPGSSIAGSTNRLSSRSALGHTIGRSRAT